jgi:DNA-binding CsgD family transcriptional regulator
LGGIREICDVPIKAGRNSTDSDGIISDLYDGVMDDVAWRRALTGIARSVGGQGPGLLSINPSTGQYLRAEISGYTAGFADEFRVQWAHKDIRFAAGLSVPLLKLHTEAMILGKGEWERTEVFNEFLGPNDAAWFLAAWIHKTPTKVTAVSIQAPRDRGPFNERDAAVAQRFMPHLRRALDLKERLEVQQVHCASLHRILNDAHFGYAILLEDGSVCEISASALSSLQSADAVHVRPGGQREIAGQVWRRLGSLADGEKSAGPFDGLMHLPRRTQLPLGIAVTRVPGVARSWLGSAPAWLMFVFDPERRVNASVDLLMQDLGVTRREAELAALLAEGQDLQSIARRLSISEDTARKHLKSIYTKTDLHSQADLVRRILTSPAWIRSA